MLRKPWVLLIALAALALTGGGALAQEASPAGVDVPLPGCLAAPGDQDEYFFSHQIGIFLHGRTWYLQGVELELQFDQRGQPQDVAGHCWQPALDAGGLKRYIGKHYNTGPLGMGGMPGFWSSDGGDHAQLYWVDLVISRWSPEIALLRSRDGYVHYHELVLAGDGCKHPTMVAWMRHTALSSFTFDGGPPQFREDGRPFRPRNQPHEVLPGIDYAFPPNYDMQYLPELLCGPEAMDDDR